MGRFVPLPLDGLLDSYIATYDQRRDLGALNTWGNSLPAEEIPFGRLVEIDAIPFALPAKGITDPDNVEPLGQRIRFDEAHLCSGIALLACGEMGDQVLSLTLVGEHPRVVTVDVPAAMLRAGATVQSGGISFTHTHFAEGYQLDSRLAALWVCRADWRPAVSAEAVELGVHPMVHIVACTLVLA
jgi:hypothetical protein